jgi:hypothetical protein
MFVVKKPPRARNMFLYARQIIRICPLSPRIVGPARRDVAPETAMDSYDTFYINKYYSLDDFMYVNNI